MWVLIPLLNSPAHSGSKDTSSFFLKVAVGTLQTFDLAYDFTEVFAVQDADLRQLMRAAGSRDGSATASKLRTVTHRRSRLSSPLGCTKSKAGRTSLQRRRAELTCTEDDEDTEKVLFCPLKRLRRAQPGLGAAQGDQEE